MKNIRSFQKMKNKNEKIVMLTAYDYISGQFAEKNGVDIILVGDSLGMVILGYDSTLKVTLNDIIHHCKATRNGAPKSFIIADMPYSTYHISIEETKRNAFRLVREGNANCVKIESGSPNRLDVISELVDCEIPVVGHVGLTPQSINKIGGYKIQGKSDNAYKRIMHEAIEIEKAGAFMIVLEGIPEKLGKDISNNLKIPTIGIGAGRFCDGQVLVYHDILNLSDIQPKFVKQYADISTVTNSAIQSYINEVKNNKFPEIDNVYYPVDDKEK
ncbi:MAG: 3-methyl-2-oxobutanoate hydroxymethyltransferase [Candidatus Cloacimonadota bacterium]|nr:3-methyl-2-oxobutanoate hydroxymethyltransferase [Candidatus Cloacimonadota bacterium]